MTTETKDAPTRRSAIDLLLEAPWAITPAGMKLVMSVASRGELLPDVRTLALEARDGKPLANTRAVAMHGSTALIPVHGVLVRHASLFTEISAATSYEALRKDFQAAIDNPAVKTIVLDVNSPGGAVTGVGELAAAIYAARGKGKRIIAYVGGTGASAAFWIAAAADEVVAAPTAELGSIGVVFALLDDRKAEEMRGEKTIEIVSSQSPFKRTDPATEDGRARLQRRADDLAAIFVEAVAKYRGVTTATVLEKFGQGDVMIGARAVTAGLADRVGSLDALLASPSSSSKPIAIPAMASAAAHGGVIDIAAITARPDFQARAEAVMRGDWRAAFGSAKPSTDAPGASAPTADPAAAYITELATMKLAPVDSVLTAIRGGQLSATQAISGERMAQGYIKTSHFPDSPDSIANIAAFRHGRPTPPPAPAQVHTFTPNSSSALDRSPQETRPMIDNSNKKGPAAVAAILEKYRPILGPPGASREEEDARARALARLIAEDEAAAQPWPDSPVGWEMLEVSERTRGTNGMLTTVDIALQAVSKAEREAARSARIEKDRATAQGFDTRNSIRRFQSRLDALVAREQLVNRDFVNASLGSAYGDSEKARKLEAELEDLRGQIEITKAKIDELEKELTKAA